ncbi:unnamed protein product [Pleuronectes platessa]|uniref:Uncharacterized protein n=1 Tax=Pleuronectes platessa TaxID=8262 RepID=A0A9N7Z520_PLEPL|nr:unnamed protein product [Pleuronectes platessa]
MAVRRFALELVCPPHSKDMQIEVRVMSDSKVTLCPRETVTRRQENGATNTGVSKMTVRLMMSPDLSARTGVTHSGRPVVEAASIQDRCRSRIVACDPGGG